MARHLLLITYDGGPSNFLPGVERDHENYLRFFKSSVGGSYQNQEIVDICNVCSHTYLDTLIASIRQHDMAPVWLIVFSGHGHGRTNGDSVMSMGPNFDCSVDRLMRMLCPNPCLVIADCCRKIEATFPKYKSFLKANFNIAFATAFDDFAVEDDSGGLYTQSLLKSSRFLILKRQTTQAICVVHQHASALVYVKTSRGQHPEIIGNEITSIPFAFV